MRHGADDAAAAEGGRAEPFAGGFGRPVEPDVNSTTAGWAAGISSGASAVPGSAAG
jgi:hypothetical protein